MENLTYLFAKGVAGVLGAFIALLAPTVPYCLICTVAIFYDCFSAYQLCKRLKRNHPESRVEPFFTSDGVRRAFGTVLRVYAIIVLCYLIDTYIIDFIDMHLANIVSGAFCLLQVWSILENESSENDARWAQVLQKIMVDKAKKYLDIDIDGTQSTKGDSER